MRKNNKKMDLVILLDRSGSMSGSENETIKGYNKLIENQKINNKDIKVTTILFDNEYQILHDKVDINKIPKLTNKKYFVRGSTALLDAIGKTINLIKSKTNNKVLFVITTDGLENASREYNKQQIQELIKTQKSWEFIYIGANIDSYSEGMNIGIKRSNIANYSKTKDGIDNLFSAVELATDSFYKKSRINKNWSQKLKDQDIS